MQLSRLAERTHFLHDGRASTVLGAIQAHGGQAAGSVVSFGGLSAGDRDALLAFLGCI
jgi:CxxC motif-containing protein (DUF1111 family)